MRRVREMNKVRLIKDLDPRNRFLSIPVLKKLFHLWLVHSCDLMTTHASLNRRDSSHCGSARVGVAVLTGDFKITRVDFMAELNGLLWAVHAAICRKQNSADYQYGDNSGNDNFPYTSHFFTIASL